MRAASCALLLLGLWQMLVVATVAVPEALWRSGATSVAAAAAAALNDGAVGLHEMAVPMAMR
jgi:hypothetical protein